MPTLVGDRISSSLNVVGDICSLFQQHRQGFFGLYFDQQGVIRGISPNAKPSYQISRDWVTLEDLLISQQSSEWQPLTLEDQYMLAITLSSSFLQLHSTPWLAGKWSTKDVAFFRFNIEGQRRPIDLQHPFVFQSFPKTYPNPMSITESMQTNASSSLEEDSRNLLILATILLEIRLNRSIKDVREREGFDATTISNEVADLALIKRWISLEKGNLSYAFTDAVSFCMRCFADPATNLNDMGFRESIVSNVVEPLMKELYHWQEGF